MWHNPTNVLPDDSGDYLVVRRFTGADEPDFFGIEIAFYDAAKSRWLDTGIDITASVVAWCPLPDLPPWLNITR